MSAIIYKCPNCGGDLKFDPESQQYKCEYCTSYFSQEDVDRSDTGRRQDTSEKEEWTSGNKGDAAVYSCPSCGAEIVTDPTTAATFCYYCHNPVVLSGRLSGKYLPDKVIPFAVDREKAIKSFLEYVHSRKFVPANFFSKDQIEKITGVYYPYWIYTADVEGQLDAEATNVRVWRGGNIEYTETSHYEVERAGSIHFGGYTRNALQKNDRMLAEGVQPFNADGMKDFTMSYLSGFMAEKRDIGKERLASEAREDIREYSEKMLRDSVNGYSSVLKKSTNITFEKENWEYALLPVWVLTYRGKNGATYYYTMNGQTEKVCGKLPVDYGRLAMLFAAIAVPVFLIFLLGGYFI